VAAPLSQPTFRRLFPAYLWRERRGLSLVFWSIVAAALLAIGVFLSSLLVDLLAHRGLVTVAAADAEQFRGVVAGSHFEPAENAADDELRLSDSGLLPTVWRTRARWWNPPLREAWQRISLLQSNFGALVLILGSLLIVGLVRVIAVSRCRIQASRLAMEAATSLRRAIHRQALRLGPSDLGGAEQQTALELFGDVSNAARRSLAQWLLGVIRAPLEFLSLISLLLAADWRLGLQCLIPLAAIGWVAFEERRRGAEIRRLADAEADAELRPLAEGIRKTRLVRAFGMEEFEHTQFQTHLDRYSSRMLSGRMGENWAIRSARLMAVALIVVIAYLLSARVLANGAPLSVGGVWLVAACLIGLVVIFESLKALPGFKQQATLAGERVYRYLAQSPEVSQAVGAKFLNPLAQSIIFEAVTYRRDGQPLLERLDMRVPAKSTTAIVSADALSARAIAYLLPRFIEPHSGRILFDSEDIAWATLESLRAETIYVAADDPFFTGTVMENLVCGETRFSAQEALEACKLVHAHKFITQLSNGYETQLGEHGEQLTAGQAFRLGLARAVLRNPAMLIIEEPQARLDDDSKALIDDAYTRLVKDRTVFFLPTRLPTVKLCDTVVFLRDGRVEMIGPHADMIRTCEGYRHWEYVNFSSLSRVKV
jgi:ATP-binding cassette subfamily B protein